MGSQSHSEDDKTAVSGAIDPKLLPKPSASYRRQAWIQFQRALDPLAPIKPLPPPRP